MALTVLSLPVPSSGVGTAVDTHLLDAQKTFVLDGTLGPNESLVIEATEDPAGLVGFTGLVAWTNSNPGDITINVVAAFMRVNRTSPQAGFTPTASVAATTLGTNTYFELPVPTLLVGGSGPGAAVDVSSGGPASSFSVHVGSGYGPNEQLVIQGSQDNVSWNGLVAFSSKVLPGFFSVSYKFLRVFRVSAGTAVMRMFVGTAQDASTSGGGVVSVSAGTAISVTGSGTNPVVNNTGVTSAIAGTGIGVSAATGAVTFSNTGVTSIIAGTNITVSGATGAVTINATGGGGGGVTSLAAGTGISVSASTGAVTVSNTGVTSAVAGTGIGVSGATGAVTFSNTGVTSIIAGTNIAISGATGAVTINATGGGGGGVTSIAAGTGITVSASTGAVTVTSNLSTGVSGGQSVIGGTVAGNSLTVSSTTNGTKGTVIFGTTAGMVYHEDTSNLSIGIAAPTFTNAQWQYARSVNGYTAQWVNNQSTGAGAIVGYLLGTGATPFAGAGFAELIQFGTNFTPSGVQVPNATQLDSSGALNLIAFGGTGLNFCTGTIAVRYNIDVNGENVWNTATGTESMRLSGGGVLTLKGAGGTLGTFTLNPNLPYVALQSGAPTAQAHGTTLYYAITSPSVSRTSTRFDAVLFDSTTSTVTGGAGGLGDYWAYMRIAPQTFSAAAATTGYVTALEVDGPVLGNISGAGPAGFAILLNDPSAEGTANLGLSDGGIFVSNIVGWAGGAAGLNISVPGTHVLQFQSGVAQDGSGGNVEGTLVAGNWALGRVTGLAISPTGDTTITGATFVSASVTGGASLLISGGVLTIAAPSSGASLTLNTGVATMAGATLNINTTALSLGASLLAANGSVATVLTGVGPAGAHTTVQEWMVVKGTGGATRWSPLF